MLSSRGWGLHHKMCWSPPSMSDGLTGGGSHSLDFAPLVLCIFLFCGAYECDVITCSRQWPQHRCPLISTFYFCARKSDRFSSNSSNCLLTVPLWRESDVGNIAGVTERLKHQILMLISKYKPASTALPKISFHLSVFSNDRLYFYLFFLLM